MILVMVLMSLCFNVYKILESYLKTKHILYSMNNAPLLRINILRKTTMFPEKNPNINTIPEGGGDRVYLSQST